MYDVCRRCCVVQNLYLCGFSHALNICIHSFILFLVNSGATCGAGIEAACLEEHHDEEEHHDDEDDHGHTEEGVDDHAGEEKDDHDDHDSHDDHDDHDEEKEDDHDDHGDHDGHDHGHEGDDHSDEEVMTMDSPSSAPIRGVVAAALAIAAGSLMIA